MIFLSNAALRYAVDVCQEREGHKVGIAIQGEDKRNAMRELILSMVSDSDCIERIRNSKYNFEILFKNGSIIKFVYPSDNARGNRWHLLIADKEIRYDVMQNVLKRCELLDWHEYQFEHLHEYQLEKTNIKDSF